MKWITTDPGESTGYSVWDDGTLVVAGQADLDEYVEAVAIAGGLYNGHLEPLRPRVDPELVAQLRGWELIVIEDWALYPWVIAEGGLDFDKCRTARGIGQLTFIAGALGKQAVLQPAAIKDASEAAGAEQLFLTPLHENRHANDAIRHGIYYRLVGRRQDGD